MVGWGGCMHIFPHIWITALGIHAQWPASLSDIWCYLGRTVQGRIQEFFQGCLIFGVKLISYIQANNNIKITSFVITVPNMKTVKIAKPLVPHTRQHTPLKEVAFGGGTLVQVDCHPLSRSFFGSR